MGEPIQKKKALGPEAPRTEAADDVALICGATENGDALGVLRKRGERIEAAVMRRAVEGQPIHGELVKLTPRAEPLLFDVESLYTPPTAAAGDRDGDEPGRPAQVSSERYRKGWDRLFKRKKPTPDAAN